jgi:hypothetical protein
LSATRSGRHYVPGAGFTLRRDYTRIGDHIFYGWLPGGGSPIQQHQIFLRAVTFLRNEDSSVETLEMGPAWTGRLKSGADFQVQATLVREDLRQGFSLAQDVDIPAATYTYPTFLALYNSPTTQRLRWTFRLTSGGFFDGHRLSPSILPMWRPSKHFYVSGFYGLDALRFPDRDQRITAHVARLRLETMLDTRLSAVTFIQYNSAIDAVVGNFRLRFNRGDGRDFYLVYNEQLNTVRNQVTPALPLTAHRAVLAKYTHTLVW